MKRNDNMEDKKLLKVLKVQRTKLINKSVKTVEEFIEIQDKLNEIEARIKEMER
jgi:TnpA family transposase